jgi:DNA-directed RNA polymerase specialized sigma24 family protein
VRVAKGERLGTDLEGEFRRFVAENEPGLRRALVAAYGSERGREATAEALAYAWENWDRVSGMANPLGYLYRVGQSRGRPHRGRPVFERPPEDEIWVEPGLPAAVAALPERQRVALLLVYCEEWTQAEAAVLLNVSKGTVQRHVERGLRKLRAAMGVTRDA